MNSNQRIHLENALSLLSSVNGFDEFFEKSLKENELKEQQDFIDLIEKFEEKLKSNSDFGENESIILSNAKEASNFYSYQESDSKIFFINNSLSPKEDFLKDFLSEFNEAKTDDLLFEEVKPRRFKTITEKIALHGIDKKKLNKIFERYKEYNHPLIYYLISEPIIQAKNFSFGITILKKALKYAFRYPNFYWQSKNGVEACAWSLYQIQYLLGNKGISKIDESIPNFRIILLKLIYLYLSRYIYMSKSDIKSIDFYSNRARFVKDYEMYFIGIFGLGVNPDIQLISDYYLAYQVSVQNNLAAIPAFRQHLWESSKMYQHGSHIPNSSGGYKDIEDRTWMELVRDGELRSIMFSEKFLGEFEDHKLNLTNEQVDFVCQIAIDQNEDYEEEYMKRMNKNGA